MFLEHSQLGHYRLIQHIGGGGMGNVFLAEDTRLAQRQVAIKIMRAESGPYSDPAARQDAIRLFQREMRAITLLDHPNILTLIDFGEEKVNNVTLTYMVMPFRHEGSLVDWLQKHRSMKKLMPNDVAYFVKQGADALQHAHNRNIVHQDVKPANFLIRNRENSELPDLLLMDFGIAKINTATATASQNIRGTATFMAPEQWKGQAQPATDQYALAILAYALLTGHPPFVGQVEQVMHQHLMVQPPPPRNYNPTISPALNAVIMRALEKQPDKRFPSILAFAQAFQQAIQDNSTQKNDTIRTKVKKILPGLLAEILHNLAGRNNSTDVIKQYRRKMPAFFAILALFIISIIIAQTTYQNHIYQVNATATSIADTATANTYATEQAYVDATATVQTYETALSGNHPLAFADPLDTENHWHANSSSSTGASCQFTRTSYHISEPQKAYYMHCDADGTFSNFAFEVQLTIIQGECGGMVFRRNDSNGQEYYFHICRDGNYEMLKYISNSGSDAKTLRGNISSSITTGLNQQNTIAVVARDHTFTLYVNQQQIDQIQDPDSSYYTEGSIGLIADPQNGNATEVAYSNARVWKF